MLARASPSFNKRPKPDDVMYTRSSEQSGVQSTSNLTNTSYAQSDDHRFQYKNSDLFNNIRPCSVQLNAILNNYNDNEQHCSISRCEVKNGKTFNILITDTTFSSNLTKKSYHTRSYDDLNCKSENVVYGLECNLCRLVYVGETKGRLNKRMNGQQ